MISILIAEDHGLVREGLSYRLQKDKGFKVIGEAADGQQAIDLTKKLKPDILLLDLGLPRVHGLDVLREVTIDDLTKPIVVTMHSDEPYIFESFRSGARGYVLKESTAAELARAVRAVHAGKYYLSSLLNQEMLKSIQLKRQKNSGDPFERLTKRERLVLQMAAEGQNATEIGNRLFISPRTAETHRANLMRKLHLRSQTDLVKLAIRKKLIAI